MNAKRVLLPASLVVLVLFVSGCGASSAKGPFVNAGSPKAPVNLQVPWWQRGETTSTPTASMDQVVASARRAGMKLRVDGNGRGIPSRVVLPYPATLTTGEEVMGWCIRYGDKIELTVIPSDQPLDFEETLYAPMTPNSRGESLIYKESSVRGNRALVAESGDQLWSSGESNHYPAIVEWQEDSGVEQYPYVTYVLRADMSAAALRGVAERLARVAVD